MPIEYRHVKEVVDIVAETFNSRENPLINFVLIYRTPDGNIQRYTYPTNPANIYKILKEIKRRRLIEARQFKQKVAEVQGLEKRLG